MYRKNHVSKSLLCLLLIAVMLLGFVPETSFRASAEPMIEIVNAASDILNLDSTVPAELASSDSKYPDDVYGAADGKPFLLSEQNELGLIYGCDGGTMMYRFDNLNMAMTGRDSNGNCWVNGVNCANAQDDNPLPGDKLEACNDMVGIQSIGVDRDGTGRKEYIACVGFDNGYVKVFFQKAVTGSPLKIYPITEASWSTSVPYWLADNYLAITAGDYDGDGQDSVIVYCCGDGDEVRIYEYSPSSASTGWTKRTVTKLSSIVKNTTFTSDGSYKYKPVVSLTTGDFNGDGKDQLAFSAGFYNTSGDVDDGYQNYSCSNLEQFSSCVCVCDYTSSGWSVSSPIWMYDQSTKVMSQSGNDKTYALTIMHAGCVAAGDVNNDGIDEIVAAGYMSLDQDDNSTNCARATYTNGTLTKVSGVCNWSDRLVSAVIYPNGSGYTRTNLQPFEMSRAQKYTYTNYCREEDWGFAKLAMVCGKTNGNNSPEDVFISGILYNFEDLTPTVKYTPSFIGNSDLNKTTGNAGKNSSVTWIRNVAAGNFNGNDAGREQFVFTLWQKYMKEAKYSANVGVVTGVEFEDAVDMGGNVVEYGPPQYYACSLDASTIMSSNRMIYDTGDKTASQMIVGGSTSASINAVPVAIDIDDDGLMGRFNRSSYVYTDPEILAVLEAGPYFQEIADAGGYEDPCGTSYGISVGYGTSTSRSDNVSFEVGVALEASGPSIKTSLEMGYAMDWSHSYETAYSVETTFSYTAQSQDIVVLCRVPQLVYSYDLWDPSISTDDKWVSEAYTVRVPLSPEYYMLGIDQYNSFVDQFNAKVTKNGTVAADYTLKKIVDGVDLPSDHRGNPDKYWDAWSKAGEGNQNLSKRSFKLGHNSGFPTFEYSTTAEQTESQEISHGFHYGLVMQGGADLVVGEAWAGGYINMDYSHSTGHSTTKVNTKTSGGQVENIDADSIDGLSFEELEESYKFSWTFGKWERSLTSTNAKVPFYGYVLTGVVRREFPPQLSNGSKTVSAGYSAFSFPDLTAGLSDVMTVTKISGNSKISYDSATKSIKVAAGLSEGTYKAVFKVSNGLANLDTRFNFTVTVKDNFSISTQPADKNLKVGSTAKFTVAALGEGLSYQWYYRTSSSGSWQTTSLTGNKTATLSVKVTEGRNGYQYRCKVTDAKNRDIYSDPATLTVKTSITTQPADQNLAVGSTAKFSVEATGAGLSYQWYYRTSSSGSWKTTSLTGAKTTTLSVKVTEARNGYQYRCKITDANGKNTYSKAATLTVQGKPVITSQPSSRTASVGESVTFSVSATGATAYQWYWRKNADASWAKSTATGCTTATLTIEATSARNGYQYRCAVTNASGTVYSNAATRTIESKPVITSQPVSRTASAGESVTFSVSATDAILYQWYWRKSADSSWAKSTATGCTSSTLTIEATSSRNGYQYRCAVTNGSGTVYSNAATLTVVSKPVITTQPSDKTASVGDTVKFTVKATGASSYQWYWRKNANDTWKKSTATGCTTATLSIEATTTRSGYQYRCVVTNASGSVTSEFATLTVK